MNWLSMSEPSLTDDEFWNDHWGGRNLPIEYSRKDRYRMHRAILKVFDRYASPSVSGESSVMEIGGAPGGYLAALARSGYCANALDISTKGCEILQENFDLLGLDIDIHQMDLRTVDEANLPQYDLVYSLGVIEHFDDYDDIIALHMKIAKPGGIIIIGAPNFNGLNRPLLRLTRPDIFEWHNLDAMRVHRWLEQTPVEESELVWRGYIGGFNPQIFLNANRKFVPRILSFVADMSNRVMNRLPGTGIINSRYWSGYGMAVYRKELSKSK